jgi:hypothetical protein
MAAFWVKRHRFGVARCQAQASIGTKTCIRVPQIVQANSNQLGTLCNSGIETLVRTPFGGCQKSLPNFSIIFILMGLF